MLIGRAPAPPLSAFVDVLWHADGWKPPHAAERHMPDGSVNLVLMLDESGGFAVVSGPRSSSMRLDTSRTSTLIGAHFRRGAAAPFLDTPVSALANSAATLADAAGRSAASLHEQLVAARTAQSRLALLEAWLAQRLLRAPAMDPAIGWAVGQITRRPAVRIADVSGQIGRSSRWFVSRFEAQVGLTPKVFSRVQRFQLALRHANACSGITLAQLAAAAGYFDQAHFNHDFRAIAGITPTAYLAARTPHQNHVAIID